MTRTQIFTILFTIHAIASGIAFDKSMYGLTVAFIVLAIFWIFATVEAFGSDGVDAKRKKEDALKTERGQSRAIN